MRTRIKICGIRSLEDACQAVNAGADALGFVFYEPSPRYITPEQAREIISVLPPFVASVGLFVNSEESFVEEVFYNSGLTVAQFHGDEDEKFCASFGFPYIKAIRVQSSADIIEADAKFKKAQGLLLDAYKKGVPGGTGESFDWAMIPEKVASPIILAGGLNSSNVGKAVGTVHPYAVDVSGGVELRKGVKDHAKVISFIKEVSRVSEY